MRTGSMPGDVADVLKDFSVKSSSNIVRVQFRPQAPFGGRYFGVYVNSRLAGVYYVASEELFSADFPAPTSSAYASVYVEDFADWPVGYDPRLGVDEFEAEAADRIALKWTAAPVFSAVNTGAFTSPSFDGLKRYANCMQVENNPLWGRLRLETVTVGGVTSMNLYAGNTLVAYGSRTGAGTFTLVEVDSSGVSGTVDWDGSGGDVDAEDEAYFDARWPSAYQIHYSTYTLSFPRTPEATLYDDGGSNNFRFVSGKLDSGVYEAAILAVSSEGVVDAATAASATVTINAPPLPPTDLDYLSGDAEATTVAWTASGTLYDVTYNVYANKFMDEAVDMSEPVGSTASTSYELPVPGHTLASAYGPVVEDDWSGIRRVVVRAVKNGIEEKNGIELRMEFDSDGVYVAKRPSHAAIGDVEISGLSFDVTGWYDGAEEEGAATQLKLFLWADGDSPDWDTAEDTQALTAGALQKSAVLSGSVLYAGYYWISIRPATAGGVLGNAMPKRRIYLSDAEPNDVSGLEAKPARG